MVWMKRTVSRLVSPLGSLFHSLVRFRVSLYERGILETRGLTRPVVAVGNLSLGGTGKTPIVGYLAELLQGHGRVPVILSRGYRGKAESSGILVTDGKRILCTPDQCGDEPYLLARNLTGVQIAVGKDRQRASKLVTSLPANSVFVLDDAFQHLKLARDVNLLVVDVTAPPWEDRPIPSGRLREPLSAIRRADAIILNRSHLTVRPKTEYERRIRIWNKSAPLFSFFHELTELVDIQNNLSYDVNRFKGERVGILAGLGNPRQFIEDLKRQDYLVDEKFLFRDHHIYSQAEIDEVLTNLSELGAAALITTEKDQVRLQDLSLSAGKIFAVRIKLRCEEEAQFSDWLLSRLQTNRQS